MKKFLALFACLSIFGVALFAEPLDNNDFLAMQKFETEKLQTVRIDPEEQHCVDANAKVWIEYNPAYHEARIYYDTLYVTFAKDEALNTILAVREDFMLDKKYKYFKYIEADREKPYKAERGNRVQYMTYLKFDY